MLVSYRGVESFLQMTGFEDVGLVPMPTAVSNLCSSFRCLPSFVGGVFVLALVEILCLVYFVCRLLLSRKARHPSSSTSALEYGTEEGGSINFSLQGNLWVAPLPEGDWSKAVLQKSGKDKKKEKEKEKEAEKDGSKENVKRLEPIKPVIEIAPTWRHVTLKEGTLILEGADGVQEHILLEGCQVLSVSAGTSQGGKWAKRYPIKLHHSSRTLYRDCQDCLFYAESGFEKEAWSEVLRATVREKSENDWITKLKNEFREYSDGAEKHVPYLTKFHSTNEANHFTGVRNEDKSDDDKKSEEPSKKRLIFNKLFRRNSKGKNSKENTRSPNAIEELGNFTRRFSQVQNEGSSRKGKEYNVSDDPDDSKSASRTSHVSNGSISRSESASSDSDGEKLAPATTQKDEKESDEVPPTAPVHGPESERAGKEADQGLLCLNMLVGRLFFDFYHCDTRVAWVQNHFQKLISKIKTPSYIKSITIKEIDLGKDPPFATALRMLPADSAGALAVEVDLEWYCGGFITIETRVDVRDQLAQEKVASQMAEPGSAGAAAAAVLSGIGEDLETAQVSSVVTDLKQAATTKKSGPGDDSSLKGRWMNSVKTMMSRVAVQVSQVPLLLKIRLVSVKGTCRICVRAPPSDRIWFSFKEMPIIDLAPEPCIGDHRISIVPLGSFIANQIKVQIRESIVTPYSQDLFLHWMMGEKDDWIPQSGVPVAFSAILNSENERQSSKPNSDVQPKPVEGNGKSGQLLSSRNGQSEAPQISDSPSQSIGHDSPASLPLPPQSSSHGLVTQIPPTPAPPLQTSVSASGTTRNQSRFAANSEQPSLERSRASAPPSIREDNESDLTTPLLDDEDEDYGKDTPLHSNSELDAVASDRVTARPLDRDLSKHLEGSTLQNEPQIPSNQLQVSNPDQSKADLSKDSEGNVSSRRSKVLSFGKKGITKLEEKRRIALERLQKKKPEAAEGGSSRHSGHLSSS